MSSVDWPRSGAVPLPLRSATFTPGSVTRLVAYPDERAVHRVPGDRGRHGSLGRLPDGLVAGFENAALPIAHPTHQKTPRAVPHCQARCIESTDAGAPRKSERCCGSPCTEVRRMSRRKSLSRRKGGPPAAHEGKIRFGRSSDCAMQECPQVVVAKGFYQEAIDARLPQRLTLSIGQPGPGHQDDPGERLRVS